jgi:FkbM family methyltransferase
MSGLGQRLIDSLATAPATRPVRTRFFRLALRGMRRIGDAGESSVSYTLEGRALALPLSHDLPLYVGSNPYYGLNLTRIVRAVSEKYPSPAVIDIGANVGDSAVRMLAGGAGRVLCVEGDAVFGRFLALNTLRLAEVQVERAFVHADENHRVPLRVARGAGTSRLSEEGEPLSSPLRSLRDILADHPRFFEAKAVKIDTDGLVLQLAAAAITELRGSRPVVFLVYDPGFYEEGEGPRGLERLAALGYTRALVWDNLGEYILAVGLEERARVCELTAYFAHGRRKGYCDIALFTPSDDDVFERAREAELEFFAARGPS